MNKNKFKLLVIPFIIFFIIIIYFISNYSIKEFEGYEGKNQYGFISFERNGYLYSYRFIPCEEIRNNHIPGDYYTFDFYTVHEKYRINCSINIFTEDVSDTIHSQFKSNIINKEAFKKVVITTKMKSYEIELYQMAK